MFMFYQIVKYVEFGKKPESDRPEYEELKATDQCNINHEKSSGSMEPPRAVEIFPHEHSVQKHKLV